MPSSIAIASKCEASPMKYLFIWIAHGYRRPILLDVKLNLVKLDIIYL
jgi:hypothetical protein